MKRETPQQLPALSEVCFDFEAIPIWELAAEISAQVPDEEWRKLPSDLARRFDRYQKHRDKERVDAHYTQLPSTFDQLVGRTDQ